MKEQRLTFSKTDTNSKELKISNQVFPSLSRNYIQVGPGGLKIKWGKIV